MLAAMQGQGVWLWLRCALRCARWLLPLLALLVVSLAAARGMLSLCRLGARLFRQRAIVRDIPGPRLEHVLRLWRSRRSKAAVSDLIHDVLREHYADGIFKFWSGPVLFVLLMRADDAECLLTSKRVVEKSFVYNFLGALLGHGLLHLSGERWRRRRRIVAPYFSPEVLRGFPEVFDARGRVLVELLRPHAEQAAGTVNLLPHVGMTVTDMVCHTVMATDLDPRALEQGGISRAMNSGLAIIMYRVFNPWFLNDALFRLSAFYANFKSVMDLFDSFTMKLLSTKRLERQLRNSSRANVATPATEGSRKKPTFLDVMLDTDAALSDTELVDEAKTLVTAATAGSTDSLCFVLLCIALQQDVQDRIFQEMSEVFGDDVDSTITPDDLRHLEFLDRVIKETLRMFPTIPQFGRSLTEDMTLPSGQNLPAGAQVFVYTPALHMDSQHFPEPDKFDPDRFLPERSAGRHSFSYLPFGAGPHICIGQRYAMMQIKSTVTLLLRHYKLLPAGPPFPATLGDIRTNLLVIQQARGGYPVRLQPRRPTQT